MHTAAQSAVVHQKTQSTRMDSRTRKCSQKLVEYFLIFIHHTAQPFIGLPSLWFQRLPHKQAVGSSNPGFPELGL